MGGLLTTGSILAAFFAGAVALFSPCCIVFLFPAYLASAVKARRWRLLPLTLVFAAGIALVLVPITLGIGMLATALARYHLPLYVAGGLLLDLSQDCGSCDHRRVAGRRLDTDAMRGAPLDGLGRVAPVKQCGGHAEAERVSAARPVCDLNVLRGVAACIWSVATS